MKMMLVTGSSALAATGLRILVDPASPWAQRLGWTLLHSVWQVMLVALLAKLIFTALQSRSARSRYLAGVTCLGLVVALPVVTWPLVTITDTPRQAEPALLPNPFPSSDNPQEIGIAKVFRNDAAQLPVVDGNSFLKESAKRPEGTSIAHDHGSMPPTRLDLSSWVASLQEWLRPWLGLVVSLWIVGVLIASVRPIAGLWMQWRLQHHGLLAVPDRLHQQLQVLANRLEIGGIVRIAESTLVKGPMVVGYLRPIVLLPASVLSGLTPAQLESLLAHELAHVRRHDWIVNALQVVIETLLFYHPAVWWLSRQIRHERELCCDDLAIAVIGDRPTYGRMLLALEQLRQPIVMPALSATGGDLVARIRRLLPAQAVESTAGPGRMPGLIVLGLLAACFIVLPAVIPVDAQPQQQNQPQASTGATVQRQAPAVDRSAVEIMSFDGILRNRDNVPIAGGEVVLSLVNTVDGQDQTVFVSTATTNAHGKYTLSISERYRPDCLSNTRLVVWALANSYGVTIAKIGVGTELADAAPPVRGHTVTVKVSAPDGRPVTGEVTQLDLSGLQIPPQFVERMIRSRENGLIEIRQMPRMPDDSEEHDLDLRTLWLRTKDFGLQSFRWGAYQLNVREGERPVELTAQPLGKIRGQLVAVDGQLPAVLMGQTQIELETFNGDSSFKTPWVLGHVTTVTNAAGQFETPIAAGKLTRVRARLPEGSRWKALLEKRDATFVAPGEALLINVPLVATRRVQGVVLQADRQGFPGLEFYVSHGDLQTSQLDDDRRSTTSAYNDSIITDSNGRFAVDVVPGEISLTWQFDPGGHIGTSELWPDHKAAPLELTARGLINVPPGQEDFTIPPITLTPYSGKLLDETGQPMEGVLRAGGTGRGMTRTKPDGTFSMNVLGLPTEWIASRIGETADFGLPKSDAPSVKVISQSPLVLQVAAQVQELKPLEIDQNERPGGAEPRQEAPADTKLSWSAIGRVLDEKGQPIEGAIVYASTGMGSLFTTASATTDAQGRYEFQFTPGISLANDDVQLQFATIAVRKPGFFEKNLSRQGDLLMARKLPEKLTWERRTNDDIILPGQPRKLDFVLLPAARLAGTVIDESDKSLVGYSVSLTGKDLPPSASVIGSTKTDEKGHFELTEIPTTFKYQILVEPAKQAPPWNAWASGPYEFHFSQEDEFFVKFKDHEVAANRFEIKLMGPGINWREALQRGAALDKLEPHGEYMTVHAARLRVPLNSEVPESAKPEGGGELPRRN